MAPPTHLYHILLTTHAIPIPFNPSNTPEKLRCPGTYTSLPSAQAAAHKALFDLGLERTFFPTYEINEAFFAAHSNELADVGGLAVHAVAKDGSVWQVRVLETVNKEGWEASWEDGRVGRDVYLVVRTRVRAGEEDGGVREHVVLEARGKWAEASEVAKGALEGRRAEFEVFEVAGEDGVSELGENVCVHAVGKEGENVVVSVVKVVELEAVRVGEASMRIR